MPLRPTTPTRTLSLRGALLLGAGAAGVALCAGAPAAHAEPAEAVGSVVLSPQCTPVGTVFTPSVPIVDPARGTVWVTPGSSQFVGEPVPGVHVAVPSENVWAHECLGR